MGIGVLPFHPLNGMLHMLVNGDHHTISNILKPPHFPTFSDCVHAQLEGAKHLGLYRRTRNLW